MNHFTFTAELERIEDCLEIEVSYTITPDIAATRWQPAEGGDIEIDSVTHEGRELPLSEDELEWLADVCAGRSRGDMLEEAAEYGDYLRNQAQDRAMMERF